MFAARHSDINFLKSGLPHLTGQLKSRAPKVKDIIRNLSLRNYLVDRYTRLHPTHRLLLPPDVTLRLTGSESVTLSLL
jgi:hypothetical protein